MPRHHHREDDEANGDRHPTAAGDFDHVGGEENGVDDEKATATAPLSV
jgi:hypothetical protein